MRRSADTNYSDDDLSADRLRDAFRRVAEAMRRAAEDADRNPDDVRLLAATKNVAAERIAVALNLGHRLFGENRVQEAIAKWSDLRDQFADAELRLIGPLQTNKAKDAVMTFNVIESVDRLRLAEALRRAADATGRTPRILAQVNTGEEASKSGVAPRDADRLVAACRSLELEIVGLMCVPPIDEPPSPHFALLADIAERNGLAELSMGMSGDFESAIRMGATSVRMGAALFGARPAP